MLVWRTVYAVARPLLFQLDPETAHGLVFAGLAALGPLARQVARWSTPAPDPRLATEVAGLHLPAPIGLAAGLDKDARLARLWPCFGFGFVELGTVTAVPQPGNPRPRLFRFPEQQALVNRMGFNNAGSEALAARLAGLRRSGWRPVTPVGVNLGKSKVTPLEEAVDDYATSTERVASLADYLVVNVSSPNTPGLRSLQEADSLSAILRGVVARSEGRPVLVKLAPDLGDEALVEAAGVAAAAGARGLIATNTTIGRPGGVPDVGAGGLSGRPLLPRALEVVALLARESTLPVIGVGGVAAVDDVLAMFAAGARAVQVFSALIFQGPTLASRLHAGLTAELDRRGLASLDELAAELRG